MSEELRIGVLVSLFWHAAVFSLAGVYFEKEEPVMHSPLVFLGNVFLSVPEAPFFLPPERLKSLHSDRALPKAEKKVDLNNADFLQKPEISAALHGDKKPQSRQIFLSGDFISPGNSSERTLLFYPRLPHDLMLYFNDRSTVHIELEFFVSSSGKVFEVKRKLSSGSLDVDLLVWRYMSQWLFVHRKQLKPDSWQTVKVDLSPPGPGL